MKSELRMARRILRLSFYRIVKRKWYLPNIPEITADELFDRLNSPNPPLILDLRSREDFEGRGQNKYNKDGHIQGAKWIPIMNLTSQYDDLPKDRDLVTVCPGGGMSLVGVELLTKAGFKNVKSLQGGIWGWAKKGFPLIKVIEPSKSPDDEIKPETHDTRKMLEKGLAEQYLGEISHTVDARNLFCPEPILKSKKALKKLKPNQVLEILTTDPGSKADIPTWANVTGQELLVSEELDAKNFRFLVRKLN